MWGSESMTLSESVIVSLVGFSIVFLVLISLAIFVRIISSVVASVAKNKEKDDTKPAPAKAQAKQPAASAEQKKDGELIAVIVAAISEDMKRPVDQFKIVSINEKK
ncbi:MAG: OadG family protein [Peptoniphilus sp.]|nr:OadG family protein [Peptoniphilus sp.]